MNGKLILLGTGGSMGVPMVGCKCLQCVSTDPRHKRLRASALFVVGDKKVLIDVGPDFRAQALRMDLSHLDAVLITRRSCWKSLTRPPEILLEEVSTVTR